MVKGQVNMKGFLGEGDVTTIAKTFEVNRITVYRALAGEYKSAVCKNIRKHTLDLYKKKQEGLTTLIANVEAEIVSNHQTIQDNAITNN